MASLLASPFHRAEFVEDERVYIRLQAKAAAELALAAGFPVFPSPLPNTQVKVRDEVPCPACGQGHLSRFWWMGRHSLVAGANCIRNHVFIMRLPFPVVWGGAEA
ncbi:hypothetical protein [Streptomyces sp. bgisy060]|uniref:hypothetical protein n=1 Tax=Streptomyces sp. bgisy060 TaxID=3413775 RepID=UPI003EB83261